MRMVGGRGGGEDGVREDGDGFAPVVLGYGREVVVGAEGLQVDVASDLWG